MPELDTAALCVRYGQDPTRIDPQEARRDVVALLDLLADTRTELDEERRELEHQRRTATTNGQIVTRLNGQILAAEAQRDEALETLADPETDAGRLRVQIGAVHAVVDRWLGIVRIVAPAANPTIPLTAAVAALLPALGADPAEVEQVTAGVRADDAADARRAGGEIETRDAEIVRLGRQVAELRRVLERIQRQDMGTDEDEVAPDFLPDGLNVCDDCWSVEIATVALLRTDPARADL